MAKKQIDGDGLDIPNRIKALPVKRTGPIVAAVVVALLAAMLLQGLITNPRFEWNVVWKYLFNENVLEGIKYTLLLTVISMGIAIILAVILAVMRKSINPVLRGVSWFYIWFFRGTPVYTQLVFWGLFAVLVPRIGVGIPFTSIEFWSIDSQSVITAFNAAWLGLALNEAAYLAEIVRAGLEAVDPGQTEAAKALGMKRSMIMRRVVLPQAMRIIIPPTGNEFIGMLKTTSLVNAVPFTLELQFATTAIATRLYKPIPLLIVACIFGMIYTGGFFEGVDFVTAFADCNASAGLVLGSSIALLFTFVFYRVRNVMTFQDFAACIPEGFKAMVSPMLILSLAWTLSGMTGLLGAKYYVANLLSGSAAALQYMLPVIIFLVAVFLAFATGTSWGTFSILIPIVCHAFPEGEMLVISIAACLSGAVCGDHCSPISDTTIMASAGAHCSHVNHVSTQLPYAITAASCAAVCYVITGIAQAFLGANGSLFTSLILLAVAIAVELVVLSVIRVRTNKKAAE